MNRGHQPKMRIPAPRFQEVAVTTGQENIDVLLELKAKLYRFVKEVNQWRERGVGVVKLLKDKETKTVRLIMRQKGTLKIRANHYVLPTMFFKEHQVNETSCVWHAADFTDGMLMEEIFGIRFSSVENYKSFRDKIEEITKSLAEDNEEPASSVEKKYETEKKEKPADEK